MSGSASSKWTSAGGADAWNDMVAKWTSSSALPDTDISHWAADYFHASNANFFCGVIDVSTSNQRKGVDVELRTNTLA